MSHLEQPMGIVVRCLNCHGEFHVPIPDEAYYDWLGGARIQVAWPQGSVDDRELLISGTCGTCFDAMFPRGGLP